MSREKAIGEGRKVVYQCPGCWSVSHLLQIVGVYECECGERLTLIDLRDTGGVGDSIGSIWHADRGRLLDLISEARS